MPQSSTMLRAVLLASCLFYIAWSLKCHNTQVINGETKVTGTKDCACDYCVTTRMKYSTYKMKTSECGCLTPEEKILAKNMLKGIKGLGKIAHAMSNIKCTKAGTTDDSAKFGFTFLYTCCKGNMCNALEPF